MIQGKPEDNNSAGTQEYFTDEGELERETAWVLKKEKGREKMKAESLRETEQPKTDGNVKVSAQKWTQLNVQLPH